MLLFKYAFIHFALSRAFPMRVIESEISGGATQGLRIQATAANQTGTAITTPFYTNGRDWKTEVTVGDQQLQLYLDTGSSDFWVYSTELPANETSGHALYDPTASPSFQNVSDSSWSIYYAGNMGASGYYGTDDVTIGGITASGQVVEVATAVTGVVSNFDGCDGIVGLGFNTFAGTSQRVNTFIDNVVPSLSQPVFTFDLQNSTAGTFELGYIDDSLYTGNLTTVAVDRQAGDWFVPGIYFSVEGRNLSTVPGTYDVSFDTGGEYLSLPDDLVAAYYQYVSNSVMFQPENAFGSRWYYPCTESLPDVTFHFNGTSSTAAIRGEILDSLRNDLGNGTCIGSVWALGSFVGAPFFLDYFAVYNPLTPSFAFAPKAG